MRMEGKKALVVGASQGIGRAVALRFAAEGADVVIGALDDAALPAVVAEGRQGGRRFSGVAVDVSDIDQCRRLVEEALAFLGEVDVLVNNVGGGGAKGPLHEIPLSAWDTAIALNLRAPIVCSSLVLPGMLARRRGTILHTTSTRGLSGRRHYSPYSTTKAALNQLTRCMAMDYAPYGIRVNAIAPGAIASGRSHALSAAIAPDLPPGGASPTSADRLRADALREDSALVRALRHDQAPMGRRGLPEEIAAAAVFLASDESSYVTGHILVVDGGRTAGL